MSCVSRLRSQPVPRTSWLAPRQGTSTPSSTSIGPICPGSTASSAGWPAALMRTNSRRTFSCGSGRSSGPSAGIRRSRPGSTGSRSTSSSSASAPSNVRRQRLRIGEDHFRDRCRRRPDPATSRWISKRRWTKLPDGAREIFVLHDVEGYKHRGNRGAARDLIGHVEGTTPPRENDAAEALAVNAMGTMNSHDLWTDRLSEYADDELPSRRSGAPSTSISPAATSAVRCWASCGPSPVARGR